MGLVALPRTPHYVVDPTLDLHLVHETGYEWVTRTVLTARVRDSLEELDMSRAPRRERRVLSRQLTAGVQSALEDAQHVIAAAFGNDEGPFLSCPTAGLRAVEELDHYEMLDAFVAIRNQATMLAFASRFGMPIQAQVPGLPGYTAMPWKALSRAVSQVRDAKRLINVGANHGEIIRRAEGIKFVSTADQSGWEVSTESEDGSLLWLPFYAAKRLLASEEQYRGTLGYQEQAAALIRHLAVWALSDLLRYHVVLILSIPPGARVPQVNRVADPVGRMAMTMVEFMARDSNQAFCEDPLCRKRFVKAHPLDRYCCSEHRWRAKEYRKRTRRTRRTAETPPPT